MAPALAAELSGLRHKPPLNCRQHSQPNAWPIAAIMGRSPALSSVRRRPRRASGRRRDRL